MWFFAASGPWKLNIKQQAVHSWLTEPERVRGVTVSQMWYSFILLMALSTSILRRAMLCVTFLCSLEHALKHAPFLYGGMMRRAPTSESIWSMTKPLSAMHTSPGSSNLRIPDCLVISWSDIDPVKSFEIKMTTPHGAIPIRALKVVWFLYVEKHWNVSDVGDLHLITVQSTITLTSEQYSINLTGIVARTCSLDIQIGNDPKTRC